MLLIEELEEETLLHFAKYHHLIIVIASVGTHTLDKICQKFVYRHTARNIALLAYGNYIKSSRNDRYAKPAEPRIATATM